MFLVRVRDLLGYPAIAWFEGNYAMVNYTDLNVRNFRFNIKRFHKIFEIEEELN